MFIVQRGFDMQRLRVAGGIELQLYGRHNGCGIRRIGCAVQRRFDVIVDLLQCETRRGAMVEKGDCAHFPSLLAEESRPPGAAQQESANSLARPGG